MAVGERLRGHRQHRGRGITPGVRRIAVFPGVARMALGVEIGQLDHHHGVLAQDGGRRPVIAEPRFLPLVSLGNGARQPLGRAGVKVVESLAHAVGAEEIGVDDLAGPAGRAVVKAALGRLLRVLEQLRVLHQLLHGANLRVRFGKVGGNPPRLDAAVRQHVAGRYDAALGHAVVKALADGIDPDFRGDVGFAFFHHRGHGRHRGGLYQLDFAAVARLQNEFFDVGDHARRIPVHLADGHLAAFGQRHASGDGQRHRRDNCHNPETPS